MKKSEFWRSKMHASFVRKEDLALALLEIQIPIPHPADATGLKRVRAELIENWWRVYARWIAYEQKLDDDTCISRKPYNTPSFQSARSAARVHSAKLKLCEQVLIATPEPELALFPPNKQPHEYAVWLWVACMEEIKKREIDDLFQEPETFETYGSNSKDSMLKGYRAVLKVLRDERFVPESWFTSSPINANVLKTCLKLAWGNTGEIDSNQALESNHTNFRNHCWNVYLDIFNYYIQDVKRQANWRDCFEKDGKFFCHERGRPRVVGFNSWHPTVQQWYRKNVEGTEQ